MLERNLFPRQKAILRELYKNKKREKKFCWNKPVLNGAVTSSHTIGIGCRQHRVVSASGWETSVSSSTPASAIIYDAYTSIKIKNFIKIN